MSYYRAGKAIYFKNMDQETPTLIADCESEEKAHFILDRIIGHSSNFIKDALVTCSNEFHGDMVSRAEFIGRVNGAIDVLNKLDLVKKTLFYGRDNNLNPPEGKRDATDIPTNIHSNHATAVDIIHAILGMATEAGELLEALRNAYNGNGFDWVNIKEELGDSDWYKAILAARGDFTFEEIMTLIIKKLRSRYADKFTMAEAVERNLVAERAILEDQTKPLIHEAGTADAAGVPLADENDDNVEFNYANQDAPMRDEGDMIAGDSLQSPPLLVPADHASGPKAVSETESRADAVFDAAANIDSDSVDAPATRGNDGELSKSPAERSRPFPDEHLAHQPVRREDIE